MKCRICSGKALFFASATVLKKHKISYFRCASCGFLQTEEHYWLQEAYSNAINHADVGLVQRNLQLARATRTVISLFFDASGKFADYGGGYGLMVRLMRDYGFDFYWHDKYCNNYFAQGFEADSITDRSFELLTAFELMEHLPEPAQEVETMLKLSRNVLFTTQITPRNLPQPEAWWYYVLDQGQHISFYSMKSLSILASQFNLKLYSDGRSLHIFTEKNLSSLILKLISLRSTAPFFLRSLLGRKSLIPHDFKKFTGKDI